MSRLRALVRDAAELWREGFEQNSQAEVSA